MQQITFSLFLHSFDDKRHMSARMYGICKTLQKEKKQIPKHQERISLLSYVGYILSCFALKIIPVSSWRCVLYSRNMFALLPWSVFSVPEEQHYTNKEKISSHLTKTGRHFETFWELTGRNLCFMRYKHTRNLQQDNSLKQEWAFIELPIQHRNQSRFLHLSLKSPSSFI